MDRLVWATWATAKTEVDAPRAGVSPRRSPRGPEVLRPQWTLGGRHHTVTAGDSLDRGASVLP